MFTQQEPAAEGLLNASLMRCVLSQSNLVQLIKPAEWSEYDGQRQHSLYGLRHF